MDRAEEIMQELKAVCESLGLPVEVDRRFPVTADPQSEGAPDDMPLIVLRTGAEDADEPNFKAWDFRWQMSPFVIFFLQDRDDPDALRGQANALWLNFLSGLKASRVPQLLTRNTAPVLSRDIQPMAGRPDVVMMVVSMELSFER